jgi:hypothetical protein
VWELIWDKCRAGKYRGIGIMQSESSGDLLFAEEASELIFVLIWSIPGLGWEHYGWLLPLSTMSSISGPNLILPRLQRSTSPSRTSSCSEESSTTRSASPSLVDLRAPVRSVPTVSISLVLDLTAKVRPGWSTASVACILRSCLSSFRSPSPHSLLNALMSESTP